MTMRAVTASELTEYYTMYAAACLSKMNRGIDITTLTEGEVPQLLKVAIARSRIRLTDPATLQVDDATLMPDAATIALLL